MICMPRSKDRIIYILKHQLSLVFFHCSHPGIQSSLSHKPAKTIHIQHEGPEKYLKKCQEIMEKQDHSWRFPALPISSLFSVHQSTLARWRLTQHFLDNNLPQLTITYLLDLGGNTWQGCNHLDKKDIFRPYRSNHFLWLVMVFFPMVSQQNNFMGFKKKKKHVQSHIILSWLVV